MRFHWYIVAGIVLFFCVLFGAGDGRAAEPTSVVDANGVERRGMTVCRGGVCIQVLRPIEQFVLADEHPVHAKPMPKGPPAQTVEPPLAFPRARCVLHRAACALSLPVRVGAAALQHRPRLFSRRCH